MQQRVEQLHAHCEHCQRLTLHQRSVDVPNHILHLLLSLFLCCLWLPVWLFVAIVTVFSNEQIQFRCTHCGALQKRQRASAFARIATSQPVQQSQELEEEAEDGIDVLQSLAALPGNVDSLLKRIAGEENDIVHGFLRVLFVVALVALFAWAVWLGATLPRWVVTTSSASSGLSRFRRARV